MIKKIPFRLAVNFMLFLLSGVILYHSLILSEIIPYNITWGGRLKNVTQMRVLECVSIIVNLFMLATIAIKGGYVKAAVSKKVVNGVIWGLVAIFSLNTVGNIFAQSLFETFVFTPLTFMSAIMCFRMSQENN
jgi:hypothetical protein